MSEQIIDGPVIFSMLDLSTAHLTEHLGGDDGAIVHLKGVNAQALKHGFLLTVPEDIDEVIKEYADTPECVIGILRFAQEHGCHYVLLDADSGTVEELPTYEW